jgi:hypothetical protein
MEPEELDVTRDIEYINNEIISSTNEKDSYIKYSRALNAVSLIGAPKSQFEKYWSSKYIRRPKEHKQIMKALDNFFVTKLTPKEKMVELVVNSKDFQSEKDKALSLLLPEYKVSKKKSEKDKKEEISED